MEISIKRNEAFEVLAVSIGKSVAETESDILTRLLDNYLIQGNSEDCGTSLMNVASNSGYSVKDLIAIVLPENFKNEEIPELFNSIFIWGKAIDNECENCGCEVDCSLDGFDEHSWSAFKCSNDNCSNEWSNEPDWDTMKGGKDYE